MILPESYYVARLVRETDKELALNFLLTEWQAAYLYLIDGQGKVIESLQHDIVAKVVRITKQRDDTRKRILKLTHIMKLGN